MIAWLSNLSPEYWLAFGLLLLALEVGAGIAYLLGPGLAAILVALVHWFYPLAPLPQILLFTLGSIVSTFAYARFFRHGASDAAADGLHDRLRSMIGKEAVLASAIDGNDRIPFGDTLWRVRSGGPIGAGTKVRVTDVDGDFLLVEEI